MPLTVSDFEVRQVTCELRYPEAYLVFDKTGDIFHHLSGKFTNLHSDSPTPTQTQMTADEGTIGLEFTAARLTTNEPDSGLERFASNCKTFFDFAVNKLEISIFTRIGLRLVLHKIFDTADGPIAALNSLRLLGTGTETRFGASSQLSELTMRWEGKDLGATMRLKAESGSLDAKFPPELGMAQRSVHKEFHHLVLDIDYYTVAIVERAQWDPATWIAQSARIMRKEADRFLTT
ncbi:MAG: hypothetical protein LAN59_14225 [Acidobacteriia bacterium]|nr:hypothetical protein [Terriglobia bacterium]